MARLPNDRRHANNNNNNSNNSNNNNDNNNNIGYTYIAESDEYFFERPPDEARLLAQYYMSGRADTYRD